MSYNDSDESDGEGFIPNKIIIKQIAKSSLNSQASYPLFQAHYLTGQTILKQVRFNQRKQPLQSYNLSNNLQCYPTQFVQHHISQFTQDLPSLEQEYLNGRYDLIYSRFAKPFDFTEKSAFSKQSDYSENQIIIKPIGNVQNFRPLKSWNSQYIQYSQQSILKFDSKFEGGNLLSAFKHHQKQNQYTFFMQNDTNTYGYNQWFYFSIRRTLSKQKYIFKIANFRKNYSFFPKGMQVYQFSLQQSKKKETGWSLAGSKYKYYPSHFFQGTNKYYTLQFQIQFQHDNDFVLIAPSLPYGYSKLISQMTKYQQEASKKGIKISMVSISRSLGGNSVPYLKIYKQSTEQKKIVAIVARQHSGEVWSSHVLDQIIKGIAQQANKFYQWAIQEYDFHVFPMVNVDGVIYGNFRCDMGGYDFNRCWKNPSYRLQPQIFKIKQKLSELKQNRLFDYFLDLHTHSRQHGFFGYSCSNSQLSRAYPLILSYLTPRFRYQACTFNITADKKTTARSEVYELTHHHQIITIQISAFGYRDSQTKRLCPFVPRDMNSIGSAIVHAFYYNKFRSQPIQKIDFQCISQIRPYDSNYPILEDEQNGSESDSQPQIDQIEQAIKMKNILKFVRQLSPEKKVRKKRIKRFKTNMNLTNSNKSFFQGENSLRVELIPRARAVTEQKRKKQSNLTQSNVIRKNMKNIADPKYTLNSFKKMLKYSPINIAKSQLNAQIKIQLVQEPKPLNLMDFSLKKLPIYKSDKLPLMFQTADGPRNFANFSNSKKIAIKDANPKTKVATFYKPRQIYQQKKPLSNQNHQLLCIFPQSKKRQYFQKIKERRIKQSDLSKKNSQKMGKMMQSTVLERYSRKNNVETVELGTKMWLKNFKLYSKSLEEDAF